MYVLEYTVCGKNYANEKLHEFGKNNAVCDNKNSNFTVKPSAIFMGRNNSKSATKSVCVLFVFI